MYVYRIEHPETTKGPYNSRAFRRALSKIKQDIYEHPEPENDGLPMFDWEYICGFSTLRQLKHWFHVDTRRVMHENGFELYRYKSDGH